MANNIQYSLQQYAAITHVQLLNQQPQPPQQPPPLMQGMNALSSYPSFPLIRLTQPQLHQPTLATNKEDANAPIRVTRPPNAYLLFNKKMRRVLKDQDPTMNVGEISKQIAERWRNMSKVKKNKKQRVDLRLE